MRAAAEAARREDGQASSDSPAAVVSATTGSAFIVPPREAPATEAPSPGREAPVAEVSVPERPVAEPPAPEAPVAEAWGPDAASPVASDALPRRVRGMSDGPQPPIRMARPALSPSLLERVRAAIQADAEAEAEDHPQEPAPIPLPRRGPAESDGSQPQAGVAQPMARPETSSPGANTEPIPVISVTAEPAALAQNAAPSKPEAAPAPPERKPDKKPAGPKAAEVKAESKAAESKAAELKAPGRATPRPAPSTHRTASRDPRTGPGAGRPAQRQARASRSYRVVGVLVATATVGALVLGWAVFHHGGKSAAQGTNAGPGSARPASAPPAGAPSAGPAVVRRDAAAWIKTQLAPGALISCDPIMCRALVSHGIPAGHLYMLKPGKTNPLDSSVIVATPTLRSQIGSKLTSIYAPGLLARFGSGDQQIQVQAIAPHGVPQYMSKVKSDLAARKMSGAALAGSPGIVASAPARKELAAGEVDSRLMTVLTGLAASHPVHIVAFGESGPDTATAPFRSAELGETNVAEMMATVSAQRSPFRAAHMKSVRLSSGRHVLLIDFTAPSPFGLLGAVPARAVDPREPKGPGLAGDRLITSARTPAVVSRPCGATRHEPPAYPPAAGPRSAAVRA